MASKSLNEVIAEGRLKKVIDLNLIKALSHALRGHILAVVNERVVSPNDVAKELDLDVAYVSYHFRVLRDSYGCIEEAGTGARRGATEHFYQAKAKFLLSDDKWRRLPASLKADISTEFLQSILDDSVGAIEGGTFNARDDMHVSWTPGNFDEVGWREQVELLNETLDRSMEIQRRSAERLAKVRERGFPGTLAILAFETTLGPVSPAAQDSVTD